MRIAKCLFCAGLLLIVLAGCGNRGPLFLPQDGPQSTPNAAKSSGGAVQDQDGAENGTDSDSDTTGGEDDDNQQHDPSQSSRWRAADPGWVSERSERHQRGRALTMPSSEAAFRQRREQGNETHAFRKI